MKLDRYFMDLPAFTFMGKPAMWQVAAQQYQVDISNNFYVVAYNSFGPRRIIDKVEFKLFMVVQREIKLTLYPVEKSKTVTGVQWRNFSVNTFHGTLKV